MTPWRWWAGEIDCEAYALAGDCATREEVIREAVRQIPRGHRFQIVEARSSEDRRHEGSDHVPFLRTRNHEILTAGVFAAQPSAEGDGHVG